jgi:hypothetical protein
MRRSGRLGLGDVGTDALNNLPSAPDASALLNSASQQAANLGQAIGVDPSQLAALPGDLKTQVNQLSSQAQQAVANQMTAQAWQTKQNMVIQGLSSLANGNGITYAEVTAAISIGLSVAFTPVVGAAAGVILTAAAAVWPEVQQFLEGVFGNQKQINPPPTGKICLGWYLAPGQSEHGTSMPLGGGDYIETPQSSWGPGAPDWKPFPFDPTQPYAILLPNDQQIGGGYLNWGDTTSIANTGSTSTYWKDFAAYLMANKPKPTLAAVFNNALYPTTALPSPNFNPFAPGVMDPRFSAPVQTATPFGTWVEGNLRLRNVIYPYVTEAFAGLPQPIVDGNLPLFPYDTYYKDGLGIWEVGPSGNTWNFSNGSSINQPTTYPVDWVASKLPTNDLYTGTNASVTGGPPIVSAGDLGVLYRNVPFLWKALSDVYIYKDAQPFHWPGPFYEFFCHALMANATNWYNCQPHTDARTLLLSCAFVWNATHASTKTIQLLPILGNSRPDGTTYDPSDLNSKVSVMELILSGLGDSTGNYQEHAPLIINMGPLLPATNITAPAASASLPTTTVVLGAAAVAGAGLWWWAGRQGKTVAQVLKGAIALENPLPGPVTIRVNGKLSAVSMDKAGYAVARVMTTDGRSVVRKRFWPTAAQKRTILSRRGQVRVKPEQFC